MAVCRPETNPGAPYITYTPISSQRLQTLDGYTGHNQVAMQIDIWADDIETTTRLAETVIQLLEARSDISARVQQDRDDHDSTTNLVRKSLDFLIWETNAMTATALNTNSTVLKIGDGVTPTEGFTNVGQITDWDGFDEKSKVIDITTWTTTTPKRRRCRDRLRRHRHGSAV